MRILVHNRPSIDDLKLFPAETLSPAENPFHFAETEQNHLPYFKEWVQMPLIESQPFQSFEELATRYESSSFLVIRNDSILYENYFNGYQQQQASIIFSVSKAITTALVGIAIDEGYLSGTDHKVAEFIPEFAKDERRDITIEHLLQMTSGLNHADLKSLLKIARLYYTKDIDDIIKRSKVRHKPGTHFAYKSIDTQILGYCLEKAVGMPITEYLHQKIWSPLGMEYNGYLTHDHENGIARVYGGIAACARDLAKIGRLYKNNGNWNGQQIVPLWWVEKSSKISLEDGAWWGYSTGWWLDTYIDCDLWEKQDFCATGLYGQYIYVNPSANIIIVRQGNNELKVNWMASMARLAKLLDVNSSAYSNKPTITLANNELKQIEGVYNNEFGQQMLLVKNKNGKWNLRPLNERKGIELEKEFPLSLFNKKQRKRVIFKVNEANEVVGIIVDDDRNDMTHWQKMVLETNNDTNGLPE